MREQRPKVHIDHHFHKLGKGHALPELGGDRSHTDAYFITTGHIGEEGGVELIMLFYEYAEFSVHHAKDKMGKIIFPIVFFQGTVELDLPFPFRNIYDDLMFADVLKIEQGKFLWEKAMEVHGHLLPFLLGHCLLLVIRGHLGEEIPVERPGRPQHILFRIPFSLFHMVIVDQDDPFQDRGLHANFFDESTSYRLLSYRSCHNFFK